MPKRQLVKLGVRLKNTIFLQKKTMADSETNFCTGKLNACLSHNFRTESASPAL